MGRDYWNDPPEDEPEDEIEFDDNFDDDDLDDDCEEPSDFEDAENRYDEAMRQRGE